MAELNFPNNPYLGQEYDFGNFIYSWDGVKWTTVSAGGNPAQDLRNELATNQGAEMIGTASGSTVQAELDKAGTGASLESLRRSYAEIGYAMDVNESFELGGTIDSHTEVLVGPGLIGYAWEGAYPKDVPPGSTPESAGGIGAGAWVDQSNTFLRNQAKAYIDSADAQLQVSIDGKSPVGHTHTPASIGAAPLEHTHDIADLSGVAAAVHGHTIADVSGLQGALDGKSAVGHTHTAAEVGAVSKAGDTMTGTLNAPDFYVTSDARLKSNKVPLTGAMAMLAGLQGYYYDKAMYLGNAPTKHEVGLIAQDVEAVLPEAITKEGAQGIRMISQSAMIAMLVEAVKELKAQVDAIVIPPVTARIAAVKAPVVTPKAASIDPATPIEEVPL